MKRLALALLLVAAVGAGVFLALNRPGAQARRGATITVDSTGDTNSRDAVLTLREAMLLATGGLDVGDLDRWEADNVSGTPGAGSDDIIIFDHAVFPLRPPTTIALGGSLPVLYTGNDTVDGSSAGVIVDGVVSWFDCFKITSDGNTIKGLQIYNCIHAVGIEGQNNTVGGSGSGEGNDLSGNVVGVSMWGAATNDNVVRGNHIDTMAAGMDGVRIGGGAHNNTVGGSSAGERNVISGGECAVSIWSNASGNTVKGNYLGTDASGTAAIHTHYGVSIEGPNNTIGGTSPGERNVISGNSWAGVSIGPDATGNKVEGNYIGTNASGTAAVPNGHGVFIGQMAENNTIGGSSPAERNVISGNSIGVYMSLGFGNSVKGNYIGTDASGTAALPNTADGVKIESPNNTVGGSGSGEGNTIAFNVGHGVHVYYSTGNAIRRNSIHSNGEKGIDNMSGGNKELAPPIVDSATGSASGHTNPKCYPCTVELFSDDEDEGRIYHGSTTTNNDATGSWTYAGAVTGPNVTATITDGDGNTSEFSAPVAVSDATPTPTPTLTPTRTPTPTPTPGVTTTPTPPTGPTRTVTWNVGWHNETWSGASTPEEAFACAAGSYAAAYRLVNGSWERYFPDRPEMSNMTDLEQYAAFLILITRDVTCHMPAAGPPGSQRTLDWGVGWNSAGWTGPDGTAPQDAFACASGSYAAAYRLVSGSWERYFPDRPEMSNMGPLNKYDAFLILVTQPVSCTMSILP